MKPGGIHFLIAAHSAWVPGASVPDADLAWAQDVSLSEARVESSLKVMPSMLRRRAGVHARAALQVAFDCLGDKRDVPILFCSRHGDVACSIGLLSDLASGSPLSPTAFGLSVHNAPAGLFTIARADHANSSALAAGKSSVEHAVIEACGLLADGEQEVLLVVYDFPLPELYAGFADEPAEPHAWAWLLRAAPSHEGAVAGAVTLSWTPIEDCRCDAGDLDPSLQILRFQLRRDAELKRYADGRCWHWIRHADAA